MLIISRICTLIFYYFTSYSSTIHTHTQMKCLQVKLLVTATQLKLQSQSRVCDNGALLSQRNNWKNRPFYNQCKTKSTHSSLLTSLFYYFVRWRVAVILCRVAMWLHPGCYKKATPAPTLERTEQCRDWVVQRLERLPVCASTSHWGGLLLRCASQEFKMCSTSKALNLLGPLLTTVVWGSWVRDISGN